MSHLFEHLTNEIVQLEISGKQFIQGKIIDSSNDLIVLFNGEEYSYIPVLHIQNFTVNYNNEEGIDEPTESPSIATNGNKENLSLRKILTEAKGMFVEIDVIGKESLHGYITSIMNNYFVFHSPVYRTMYIKLDHLKWLIPYVNDEQPFDLDRSQLSVQSTNVALARTFDIQVRKLVGEIVAFNINEKDGYIGKINKIDGQIVEIQTARAKSIYLNIHHIKTMHQV